MVDSPGPLFDWTPAPAPSSPKPPDQAAELARVLSALERHVMAFLRARIRGVGGSSIFRMSALLEFVRERQKAAGEAPCAPDSPRRVMSELKTLGCTEVRLLNRRQSLYEVISVNTE